ncbi:MAG TPA: RNA 2',3'-cyclic phosphodiesterase [Dehalococcoidia bacterium]|nr:RNA 2',3'-cyclic phosphodiesterase [Dehalococcoidia bacterium]
MRMEQIRSFIAIELPDQVKTALAELQAGLQVERQPAVKWTDPYGIHLTLKFLGNILVSQISDIASVVEEAGRNLSPFSLEVKGLGVFPNFKRVRVVWIGVGGDISQLKLLQQRIESNLVPLGFARESRQFTPHLTMARVKEKASPTEQQRFGQLIADTRFETAHKFTVRSISLMRSQLTTEGAIYHQIGTVSLKKSLSKGYD